MDRKNTGNAKEDGAAVGANDLLENAIESIENGIEDFGTGKPGRVSSALRNLYAGVLLLLKEKLRRLSPPDSNNILIFKKFKPRRTPEGAVVIEGKGQTVDLEDIQERWNSLGLSLEWNRVRRLQEIRNHVEHYRAAHSREAMRESIANVFVIVAEVLENHLDLVPASVLDDATWKTILSEAETFKVIEQACRTSRETLEGVPAVASTLVEEKLRCPECGSSLLKASGTDYQDCHLICQSCGEDLHVGSVVIASLERDYALESYFAATDGGDDPLGTCPHCHEQTYLVDEDLCVLCGETKPHASCMRCGTSIPLAEQDLDGLCGYCEHMMNKDD